MSKYTEYDKKLLALIKERPQGFIELAMRLRKDNDSFCTPWCMDTTRVTDRRLQALRKSGKIFHKGAAWHAMPDLPSGGI